MIRFWPPAFVYYTDALPDGVGGEARAFIVRIRPVYKDDSGILAHELEHVRQAWCGLLLGHALLYQFVRRYRQWAEIRAYREQMCWLRADGAYLSLDDAAWRLTSPRYNLGITIDEARAALKG